MNPLFLLMDTRSLPAGWACESCVAASMLPSELTGALTPATVAATNRNAANAAMRLETLNLRTPVSLIMVFSVTIP
mgnify:CR=1 FL=1